MSYTRNETWTAPPPPPGLGVCVGGDGGKVDSDPSRGYIALPIKEHAQPDPYFYMANIVGHNMKQGKYDNLPRTIAPDTTWSELGKDVRREGEHVLPRSSSGIGEPIFV